MAVSKLGKVYYPPPVDKKVEDQFKDAAQMYEKTFLKEMVKAMRTTVPSSGFIQESNGEKIFKDELDNEYVDQWAQKGGVGIADMIYTQLMEKYGGQNIKVRPEGPLSLENAGSFKGVATSAKNSPNLDMKFSRTGTGAETDSSAAPAVTPIQAPWQGVLKDKTPIANGYLLKIEHDNGLSSQINFRGTSPGLEKGQKIQAGQRIGLLSPEANEFFWSLGERSPQDTEEVGGSASL